MQIEKLQSRKAAQLQKQEEEATRNWDTIEEVATRVVAERNDAGTLLLLFLLYYSQA